MKDFILLVIAEIGFKISRFAKSIFNNFGLKFALWLPYALTMLFLFTGLIVIRIRYNIPMKEMYYVGTFVILYGALLDGSIYLKRKYWGVTKDGRT